MNELKLISLIALVLGLMILGNIIYYNILEPAYVSYAQACLDIKPEVYGYYQAGQTTIESGNVTIKIRDDLITEEKIKVMKHEIIHRHQLIIRKTTPKCYNVYFMELEAYTFQNLPINLFRFLYM